MSVAVQCPNPACGATQEVPEKALGRRARCRRCGQDFTLATATSLCGSPATETTLDRCRVHTPQGETAAAKPPSSPDSCPLPATAMHSPAGASVGASADASLPARFSRFEVRSRIGAGAAGVVYLAYDPLLGRDVAIKVPRESALDNPQAVARFLREPRAAAQLRHPHIVPVYDAGAEDSRYYIASAYIEGRTLEQVIAAGRPDVRRAAEICLDLADALHYAHGLGVVHLDVKPANIMLDARGDALLMDFGLARFEAGEKLTHDGTVRGTPAYMAPEQASVEFGEVGPASDQYSLGVVLYELLCGDRPFHGPPAVVIFHVLNEQPRAPRAIDADVPRDLETIALKAISKRSADRYADCRALADDLRRWLEDRPIQARQMGAVERTVRWAKKRPALAALAAALLLSAVVSTWFALALQRRGADLHRALADAQAHAERVEKANATIRERDASLVERETALQTAEAEIAMTEEALEEERQQVAAKDQELQRQLDKNARIAKERDVAQSAKKTAEETAKAAATARDEMVKSDTGWAFYKRKLLAAQAALRAGAEVEAKALLRACPKEHRSCEWTVLWSRSHGPPTTWSWSGVGQGGGRFSRSGKLLMVETESEEIAAQGDQPAQSPAPIIKVFDSATGREIDSIPIGTYALHPDEKTIAIVTGGTTVTERQLGLGGVDASLVSTAPKQIEWIGYHPDGAHLFLVERGNDEIVVRSIDRANRQQVQVAAIPAFPASRKNENATRAAKGTNDIRWPEGTFTPDGHFFLSFGRGRKLARSVLNVENDNELTLPFWNWVFSEDLSIVVDSGAHYLNRTAVLGLPLALNQRMPVQSIPCASEGSTTAISADGKRLACTTNNRSLAIWNITSPEPQLWEQVIALSEGAFSNGWGTVFSHDWMRVASQTVKPRNTRLKKSKPMRTITVESWNERAPEAAEDAKVDHNSVKEPN